MADHPLRSATHRRLGRPLPYQLPNGTRAHPYPINLLPQRDAPSWSYAVLSIVSNGYSPDMGRLLTRYSPVRHAHTPEGVLTFDLHVLSMPPAFILSQNQTLKFNCLKSLPLFKIITALTKFLLSLCWLCFLGYYKFALFSTLKKLTEITFHLLVCQIKSHFFLIPFLIFLNRTTVRAARPRRQLVYNTTNYLPLSSIFFNFFKNFLFF